MSECERKRGSNVVYTAIIIAIIVFSTTFTAIQIVSAVSPYTPHAEETGSGSNNRYGQNGTLTITYLDLLNTGTEMANLHFNFDFRFSNGFVAVGIYTGAGHPGAVGSDWEFYTDWKLDGAYASDQEDEADGNAHDYDLRYYIDWDEIEEVEYIVWCFYIDDDLVQTETTYDLDDSAGQAYVFGECTVDTATINGYFEDLMVQRSSGWNDWNNMDTTDDAPYHVTEIDNTECQIWTEG
ncbi:MAG: hypothetical protein KAX31_04560 [Thermoplasmata archaeon]|jgi:hypothetical protein|nr:hypothetical protein [Thermoplasmata archaeon]